jgi:predicted Zn finger-like uncharacterized protein
MRIVCPSCDTAYEAPDSVVASGRLMRCAQCRTEWTPGKAIEAAVPPVPATAEDLAWSGASVTLPDPEFAPEDRLLRTAEPVVAVAEPVILAPFPPMPAEPEPAKKTVIAAWVGSICLLVVAVWLAIAFRQPIMRGWPASARAYAALGYR